MKLKRTSMAALMIGGLLAVLPASASAWTSSWPTPAPTSADCPLPSLSKPLIGYGDWRSYFTAPGGTFETSSWSLAGGATLTPGSGPLRLGAARSSLRLPPGASATSPVFCVDLDYPTMRFFSTQRVLGSNSKLNVDVIYPALGTSKPKVATVSGTSSWALSKDVKLRPELVTSNSGWRFVKLRYSADWATTGDWRVDDVLIDPRMRG